SSPPTVPIPHPSVLTSTLVPGVSDRIKAFLNKMKESLDCVESMNPRDTFDAVRIWNATSEKLQEYLKRAERQLAEMEAPLTYASPSASIMWSATSNATAMKSDQNSSLPPPPGPQDQHTNLSFAQDPLLDPSDGTGGASQGSHHSASGASGDPSVNGLYNIFNPSPSGANFGSQILSPPSPPHESGTSAVDHLPSLSFFDTDMIRDFALPQDRELNGFMAS
ncbi:unnamed protein product, partial [Cyprideis torosa]